MVEMTGKNLFDGRKIINIQQYETCKHIWQKVEATTLKGKEYYRCIKCKIWREKDETRKSN